MKRSFLISALLPAAVLVVSLAAPVASAASLRVCPTARPGCQFTHIQAAINAASNGSTISIAPGTYHENLTIGGATPLSLVGPGVTIDGNKKGSVLTVMAEHSVRLVGLTLTNGSGTTIPG